VVDCAIPIDGQAIAGDLQSATRQSNNRRRQTNALAVVGSSLCRGRRLPTVFRIRPFWQVSSCEAYHLLRFNSYHHYRNEVEAEGACVVLDHHVHPRGTSCPVDPVRSLDHQVDSCTRCYPHRYSGFVCNALGYFGRREFGEKADNLGNVSRG
jgi:hypothetical protein